jgi:hypothetical protein
VRQHRVEDGVADVAEIDPGGLRVVARVNTATALLVGQVKNVKYMFGTRCVGD